MRIYAAFSFGPVADDATAEAGAWQWQDCGFASRHGAVTVQPWSRRALGTLPSLSDLEPLNLGLLWNALPTQNPGRVLCSAMSKVTVMRGLLALVALMFAATMVAAGDRLFDAVAAGDAGAVEQALAAGAAVDARAPDQATPLINAALADQPAIAELLIGKGADAMARNSGGFTPLHAAAFSGSVPISKLLLDHGATLDDAANKAGVTPLMVAGEENHVAMATFLIAEGADVGKAEVHGYTPIARAFWKGNTDIVRLFKRHGATCPPASFLGEQDYAKCMEIHD